MNTILVADDERNIRRTLEHTFTLEGYAVETVSDGKQALAVIERGGIDLLVLDWQMPGLDGLATLKRLRELEHELPIVFLSAHGTIERAVEALRLGAFDFIEKPPVAERLLLSVKNALLQRSLVEENRELRGEVSGRFDMIGKSEPMQQLYEQIRRTAPTQARVLIRGENGSGKELIARALHKYSTRCDGPFVRVNCAAIPRELFESELFGHERGAFTGATARRRGKFVRAHGGTLFFDEVGEIPSELQAKLLRALESGEVEPVGSERDVRVDVRVLAATNRDLERAVAAGEFRSDLYYRLQVMTLVAPPLRERLDDVPELARRFLEAAIEENHLSAHRWSAAALDRLTRYSYPGNVRELRNIVERLVILADCALIGAGAVSAQLAAAAGGAAPQLRSAGTLKETLSEVERDLLVAALKRHGWRMAETARELGLERSHLYKKLKAHAIERS